MVSKCPQNMSDAKSLTKEQIATIQSWADDGDELAEIQRKLGTEFSVKVTYLETRFLLDDIGVKLKPAPVPEEPEEPEAEEESDSEEDGDDAPAGSGTVTVTVDKIQRPGAIVSGKAVFSDGNEVAWWFDQMGRPGMEPKDENFTPSQEQMMDFQTELQAVIRKEGL